MSPFVSGALGAIAILFALGLLRRLFWFRRLRRWHRGGSPPLRRLFARLHTTPAQEKVISAEAEAVFREGGQLREDWQAARAELADLFSAQAFDAAAFTAALDRRLTHLGEVRARAAEALARVHATLDAEQRTALAALLRRGPGHRHGHAGCGRHAPA
jgi:uncharacterized membrane protein